MPEEITNLWGESITPKKNPARQLKEEPAMEVRRDIDHKGISDRVRQYPDAIDANSSANDIVYSIQKLWAAVQLIRVSIDDLRENRKFEENRRLKLDAQIKTLEERVASIATAQVQDADEIKKMLLEAIGEQYQDESEAAIQRQFDRAFSPHDHSAYEESSPITEAIIHGELPENYPQFQGHRSVETEYGDVNATTQNEEI